MATAKLSLLVLLGALVATGACATSTSPDGSGVADSGGDGGTIFGGDDSGFREGGPLDIATCEAAANAHSYMGCDYWPTPVANFVWSVFDYAVVVSNTGDTPADVSITGPAGFKSTTTVDPGALAKIYLPWVPELKGGDGDACGGREGQLFLASVKVPRSAYHLVTTRPVVVYQFNALEYQGKGGPPGKDWSQCPGNNYCTLAGAPLGCFSYTNDASLLLPSTALTGTYRITGTVSDGLEKMPSYVAVTGTQDGTNVTVHVGAYGKIVGGGGIADTPENGTATFTLDAGDVAEIVGYVDDHPLIVYSSDLSGSLLTADKPVQVIAGVQCIGNPVGANACDHLEESVFPAETLGKDYVVTVPTGPNGVPVGHAVRLYGNFDGTTLSYEPAPPPGAPSSIKAGEVVDLGIVANDFRVQGSQAFAVAGFQLSSSHVDPGKTIGAKGDPAQSNAIAVAQYRTKYVFLAPDDYDVSYVDIVAPAGADMTLDGATVTAPRTPVGASGFSVVRVTLGPGKNGAHLLVASAPVGIQVMGYGAYTSYQYPGGSDFVSITAPPVR